MKNVEMMPDTITIIQNILKGEKNLLRDFETFETLFCVIYIALTFLIAFFHYHKYISIQAMMYES